MYVARSSVGLGPYTATYAAVEVKDFDVDGFKGRWMAYGCYSPDRVMAALWEIMGFPVKLEVTRLEREGNRLRTILTRDEVEVIEASITLKRESLGIQGSMLNYPVLRELPAAHGTRKTVSELIVHRIPWMGEVFPAEPLSFVFQVSAKDPLKKLHPKRLLWAVHVKNDNIVFGYTDVLKQMK